VNSAIHEQCSELLLIALYSTVQLACTVNTKQQNAASSFLRHRRKKHVGSIHSKLCMDCYQTAADCVLIKTQLQSRKQTDAKISSTALILNMSTVTLSIGSHTS
jgi:hypothetical protein